MPNVLVVFYSRTGTTKRLAEAIAAIGGWDVEELVERKKRSGLVGYVRAGIDAALGRLTRLEPTGSDPSDYDLVVVGTPVWNASVSTPVRTYLMERRGSLKNVAFFLTYGGAGDKRVFRQMADVALREPVAVFAIPERELEHADLAQTAHRFVDEVLRALAGRRPPTPPSPPPRMPGEEAHAVP